VKLHRAPEPDAMLEELRAARVEVARRNWREIAPAERLVARGLGWLVDAETDFIFVRRGGTTFEPERASLLSGEGADLWFFVDRDGDPVVLERVTSPATWSEHVARREQRRLRAAS
jgi:hypothetical protein